MNQTTLDLGLNTHEDEVTLACGEQPQARIESFGVSALSDSELLAVVLQSGLATAPLMDLARRIIADAGSIAGLATWHATDFQQWPGIGHAKGHQLTAIIEMGRRLMRPPEAATPSLTRPDLVAEFLAPVARGLEIEKFWVLCLNRKNRLKKLVEVTSGTATSTLAHPREVYRAAIREGAVAVICAHNHPSGDPAPSAADIQITRQLREASKTIDIDLLDHVIVGQKAMDPIGRGVYSFREAGLI